MTVLRRVWKSGTPEQFPVATYKDDRLSGWRENYVYKLPCGDVVAVYNDVTESKRSELALRLSEQCFRAIADYTYFWEVWVGPGGRPLWTNPAIERVTGYNIREFMGLEYLIPMVYEADREKVARALKSALRGHGQRV